MIKYSIIIPVYNLENYIEKTLDSLLNISEETELIVINDGSTDNSWQIIEKYISIHDISEVQLLNRANCGVSVARNIGIEAARGEYLIFVDGDDICDNGLIKCVENVSNTKADMIVWRFNTVAGGGKVKCSQEDFRQDKYTGIELCETLLRGINRIRIGSFAVRKDLIKENGIRFTEGCAICEDVEFIYKAVLVSDNIATINDICYTYVKREGSAMNTFDMRKFQAPKAIQRIYGFAVLKHGDSLGEYIFDSLKYGLYLTHCMYAFDSSCVYITDRKERKNFLERYFAEYADVEDNIVKAKKNIKYIPDIFSKKRVSIFLFSRRVYTWYMCHKGR